MPVLTEIERQDLQLLRNLLRAIADFLRWLVTETPFIPENFSG